MPIYKLNTLEMDEMKYARSLIGAVLICILFTTLFLLGQGQKSASELFGYYVVQRQGSDEIAIVKGINRIETGDTVLGGPFNLVEAEAFKKECLRQQAAAKEQTIGISGPTPEGLVLHLPLDDISGGQVRDWGPAGLSGTLHGNPLSAQTPTGLGLFFDGKDDWIMMDSSKSLDIRGSMTVMALVKIPESLKTDGLHMIIWRGDERGGRDPYSFFFSKGRVLFRRDFPKTVMVGWSLWNLDFNQYHFFCGVHRSHEKIMEIWVDGKKVEAITMKGKIKYQTARMTTQIGAIEEGKSQLFLGIIDDIKVFNRALTDFEIEQESQSVLASQY